MSISFSKPPYSLLLATNPELGDSNKYAHSDLLLRNKAGEPFDVQANHPNKDTKTWTLRIPYAQLDEFRYFMLDTKGQPLDIIVSEPSDTFTAIVSNNAFELIEDRYACEFTVVVELILL
jgi:hypothetical protein